MIQRVSFFVLLSIAASAQSVHGPLLELLTIRPDGSMWPTGVAATVSGLANAAATAQAAIAEAQAVQSAQAMIDARISEIEQLEAARNATGYIRLFVESFTPGIEADTNNVASIVRFSLASNTLEHAYWDLWTFFTSDPGVWPYVRTAESVGRSNEWDLADSAGVSLGEVLVGSTLYEAYRNTVRMPADSTQAFFRVYADIEGVGTNQVTLPVNTGVAVNGVPGITVTLTDGTNTMSWKGGVRVQ